MFAVHVTVRLKTAVSVALSQPLRPVPFVFVSIVDPISFAVQLLSSGQVTFNTPSARAVVVNVRTRARRRAHFKKEGGRAISVYSSDYDKPTLLVQIGRAHV